MRKIIQGKYAPIPSNYSKSLKEVIKYMLTINIDERPSADQLLNDKIIQERMQKYGYSLQQQQNNLKY